MSAIIPESGKSFKGEYSYTNNYKANFIISEPNTISPQKSTTGNIKIFIGAFDKCPFPIASHDNSSEPLFNYANHAALNLFKRTLNEMMGLPSRASALPVDQDERSKILIQVSLTSNRSFHKKPHLIPIKYQSTFF